MKAILLVYLMVILAGLWVFSSKRKHVLLILLSLEFLVLGIYMFMLTEMQMGGMFFSLLYLGFSACEGALGLTILVMISRTHGGDSFNLFNLNYDKINFFNNLVNINIFKK